MNSPKGRGWGHTRTRTRAHTRGCHRERKLTLISSVWFRYKSTTSCPFVSPACPHAGLCFRGDLPPPTSLILRHRHHTPSLPLLPLLHYRRRIHTSHCWRRRKDASLCAINGYIGQEDDGPRSLCDPIKPGHALLISRSKWKIWLRQSSIAPTSVTPEQTRHTF